MQKYQQEFIENLKAHRKGKKLSQSQLAELCDVATGTIGNIECGLANPSFDLILKLAQVLNTHPALFFISKDELKNLAQENESIGDKNFLFHLEKELRDYLNMK